MYSGWPKERPSRQNRTRANALEQEISIAERELMSCLLFAVGSREKLYSFKDAEYWEDVAFASVEINYNSPRNPTPVRQNVVNALGLETA